jgi:hypothetical protein
VSQEVFDAIWSSEATLAFHAEVNRDPQASATAWQAAGAADSGVRRRRTVTFSTPVEAPAFIRRMIGKDVVLVVEEQVVEVGGPGGGAGPGALRVRSVPVLQIPGGARFATQTCFDLSNADGGCQVWLPGPDGPTRPAGCAY